MPHEPAEIVKRHAAREVVHPNEQELAPDARAAWDPLQRPDAGLLGSARTRDSARREWLVEAHREQHRLLMGEAEDEEDGR